MTAALRATLFLAGLAAVAALPLAGRALRADRRERCDLDGVAIDPLHRVRLVGQDGADHRFCCVDCFRRWTAESKSAAREVFVTDETTGREIRAEDAWFVRSRVPAFVVTGSRVHVFAEESDARRHAESFGGVAQSFRDHGLLGGD